MSNDGTKAARSANDALYRDLARAIRQASAEYVDGSCDRSEYIASAVMSLTVTRVAALASQLAEVERERDALLAGPRPWAEGDLPTAIQKGRRPGVFGARVASTRDILLMLQRSQPSVADVLDEAQRVVNERAARGDR